MSKNNLSDDSLVGMNNTLKGSIVSAFKENKLFFIGLGLGLLACIIFWMPHSYTEVQSSWIFWEKTTQKSIHLMPNLSVGLISLLLMGILYARRIISFPKEDKILTILSFIINLTLMSIYIKICLDPFEPEPKWDIFLENTKMIAAVVFCIAIIMFGVKEIAKMAVGVLIILSIFARINLVSAAMGFWGFIALILTAISFYLQQNININNLLGTLGAMYSFGTKNVKANISGATKESSEIKNKVSKSITSVKLKNHDFDDDIKNEINMAEKKIKID
ncbi:hypothetical protein E4O05_08070 [Treponema sp. OMZ 787]|uniref:hypothetical protein n=1 Tax=Treponema sp. OMZ 787 TaxID=2563669 RepID=UPI0020A4B465|nr:hypothetical protein [Treponema sp. OMZ 787]UTC61512.1 hypothetical protein E4O05_08070 [Treponema sp. OMZ 787]